MSKDEMKAFSARIGGRVQGVGFRFSAVRKARQLGVTGWIRNEFDGSVSVECEGPSANVKQFEQWLRTGPRSAHVTDADVRYREYQGKFSNFSVKH